MWLVFAEPSSAGRPPEEGGEPSEGCSTRPRGQTSRLRGHLVVMEKYIEIAGRVNGGAMWLCIILTVTAAAASADKSPGLCLFGCSSELSLCHSLW